MAGSIKLGVELNFFSFRNFIFPSIAKVVYWIGLVLIAIGAIVMIVSSLSAGSNPYLPSGSGPTIAIIGFFLALIVAAIALLIWRVVIELWLVMFSIHDVLRDIRDNQGQVR